jgi:hypothetical protein
MCPFLPIMSVDLRCGHGADPLQILQIELVGTAESERLQHGHQIGSRPIVGDARQVVHLHDTGVAQPLHHQTQARRHRLG